MESPSCKSNYGLLIYVSYKDCFLYSRGFLPFDESLIMVELTDQVSHSAPNPRETLVEDEKSISENVAVMCDRYNFVL